MTTEINSQVGMAGDGRAYLLSLGLALACVFIYGKFLNNPIFFDDVYMLQNEDQLLFYSKSFWFDFNLRWFSYVTFGWTYNFFGKDVFYHRVVNLLLHALVVISLFKFYSLLFKTILSDSSSLRGNGQRMAFWGALIFAVHPVSAYAVGYLIERSIVMATLFSVLSLHAFLKGASEKSQKWYWGAGAWFFLAVFSKEHVVMLPFAMALLVLLVRTPSKALVRELLIPFVLYSFISLLAVFKVKGLLGTPYEPHAMDMLSKMAEGGAQSIVAAKDVHLLSMVNQGHLFFKYLLLWMSPYTGWMSIDMQRAFPDTVIKWPETFGFAAFVVYPLILIGAWRKYAKWGLLWFALLFPWVMFMTELASVRVAESFVLYRSYLWMICLPIGLPVLLGWVEKKYEIVIVGALIIMLSVQAWKTLDTFSSPLKLWADAIEKFPDPHLSGNYRAYSNLGVAKARNGMDEAALADFNMAVSLNPGKDSMSYLNRGAVKLKLELFTEAYEDLTRAIEINPKNVGAYANRGIVQVYLGNREKGVNDLLKAIEMAPTVDSHRKALEWALHGGVK